MDNDCPQCQNKLIYKEETQRNYCDFCGWVEIIDQIGNNPDNDFPDDNPEPQETFEPPRTHQYHYINRQPFIRQILDAFVYPFRGNGSGFILSGLVMITVIVFLGSILYTTPDIPFHIVVASLVVFVLSIWAQANIASYAFLAIEKTVEGRIDPPKWSERSSDRKSAYIQLVLLGFILFFMFLPIYFIEYKVFSSTASSINKDFTKKMLTSMQEHEDELSTEDLVKIQQDLGKQLQVNTRPLQRLTWLFTGINALLASLFWPMAILRTAITKSVSSAVWPLPAYFSSIFQVLKDYLIVCAFIYGSFWVTYIIAFLIFIPIGMFTGFMVGLLGLVGSGGQLITILTIFFVTILIVTISMYWILVASRMLGVLYRTHAKELVF